MTSAYQGEGFLSDQTGEIPARHAAGEMSDSAENTLVLPPLGAVFTPMGERPANSPEGFATVAANSGRRGGKAAARRHGKVALVVTFSMLLALALVAIGSFFGARWYFQDKAAPGVSFGGESVTGKSAGELTGIVNAAVAHSTVTVGDGSGKKVAASLKDLGVSIDVNATVHDLLAAKSANEFARLNPFAKQSVGLSAKTDKLAAATYLTDSLVSQADRAVPSTIDFDEKAEAFSVTPGKDGKAPVMAPVEKAVSAIVAEPGHSVTVSVSYNDVVMPISEQSAKNAADQANRRLADAITIGNGDARSFTVPTSTVASWISPVGDPDKGTVTLSYDKQAIDAYMSKELPAQLDQKMVTQEDIVDTTGAVLVTKTAGVNGVAVKNTGAVAQQVVQALDQGQKADLKADADVTEHDVKQIKSEYRIVVDKSKQTATVYQNDKPIKNFLVLTGRTGSFTQSDNGTFFIYLRYKIQDMRGPNGDGTFYLTKGVKWVSYYNGGEGFHTAYWNYPGIAAGDPTLKGSHGCINMYEQDAKWIFDNCPMGTVVQVIGAQPNGPVR